MLDELISFVPCLRSCLTELNLSSMKMGEGENEKYYLQTLIRKSCGVSIMREEKPPRSLRTARSHVHSIAYGSSGVPVLLNTLPL